MNLLHALCRSVATFFGAGYLPKAPGTAGSFAALPLYLLMRRLPLKSYLVATAGVFAAGALCSEWMERQLGKDPQQVVIDEVTGVLVALLARPRGMREILLGVLLFRIFDITKPPPVGAMETLPGGIGIMMDDVVAGALSAAALAVILKLLRRRS
ncbi:MAG: phosphatidylglycerophosphatase A [Desulfomonilia bacterium]|jgi:phosphatidylglycerophosphatase A